MTSLSFASYISSKNPSYSRVRVHKLLYFAQGISLKLRQEPLFDEEFIAYPKGPVALHAFKEKDSIHQEEGGKFLDARSKIFMDAVIRHFEDNDESFLVELSHEGPWKNTKQEHIMDAKEIEEYFKTFECNDVEDRLAESKTGLLGALREFKMKNPRLCVPKGALSQTSFPKSLDDSF